MKLLIIEDNPDHLDLIKDALWSINGERFDIAAVDTLNKGVDRIMTDTFDLCLCDLSLPDADIEETIKWLNASELDIPVVVLTSLNDRKLADDLLRKGIQDFLSKEDISPELLFRTCRYAVERFKHQLKMNEQNSAMQVFCASLSHDFNGHISRIMGIGEALKNSFGSRTLLTEKDVKWFDYLDVSTKAIQSLANNLQHYLLVEYTDKKLDKVPLQSVISDAESLVKNGSQTSFTLDYSGEKVDVKGNAGFLQLMFQNLISNSIKFCDETPHISITVESINSSVKITFRDNGIGFAQEKAKLIFEPFGRLTNSSKTDGSGLGLSIVKRIVDHHEGTIGVHSKEGDGTEFIITLAKF